MCQHLKARPQLQGRVKPIGQSLTRSRLVAMGLSTLSAEVATSGDTVIAADTWSPGLPASADQLTCNTMPHRAAKGHGSLNAAQRCAAVLTSSTQTTSSRRSGSMAEGSLR